jgi:hypothetical protein
MVQFKPSVFKRLYVKWVDLFEIIKAGGHNHWNMLCGRIIEQIAQIARTG